MALRVPASRAADIAIGSIGRGYDISIDLRLKYCKGDPTDLRLIEIDEDEGRDVVLPGGITIPAVSKSIKCDKGERTRFRSDVLSFQQVLFVAFSFPIDVIYVHSCLLLHFNASFEIYFSCIVVSISAGIGKI